MNISDTQSIPADLNTATTIRAFYALVPDDAIRMQFVTLARDVARRSRGRAMMGDHVHLTLAFLGDVSVSMLPSLRKIGDRLQHAGSVLDFDLLGAWRASGVAWIAPSVVPQPLLDMHASLRDALVGAGIALDARPFRPHITLARRCVQPHPRASCAPIRWPVNRLSLIGSELRPEGPLYSELGTWELT
jgi:2'-5' RNA ligase